MAELIENKQLVGVIRGCIKCVNTAFGGRNMKIGCILGLRVSPTHRYDYFSLFILLEMELKMHIATYVSILNA